MSDKSTQMTLARVRRQTGRGGIYERERERRAAGGGERLRPLLSAGGGLSLLGGGLSRLGGGLPRLGGGLLLLLGGLLLLLGGLRLLLLGGLRSRSRSPPPRPLRQSRAMCPGCPHAKHLRETIPSGVRTPEAC